MMKKLSCTLTLVGLLIAVPTQAAPITISVSGVYDTVPALPSGVNGASSLLGTAYSASYTVSTNAADAITTQRGSSVDSSGTTIDSRGWMFVSPGPGSCDPFFNNCYGPTNNTFTTKLGSYSDGEVSGIYVGNNFYYDGLQGMLNMLVGADVGVNMAQPAGTGLSEGTYDVIGFSGDRRSFNSCTGKPVVVKLFRTHR